MVFAVALWCIHQRSAKSTPQAQKLRWPVVGKVALMLPATPKWRFLSGTLMQIFVRNLKLTSKDCLKQTGDFKRFWNGAKLCFSATSRSHGNLNKKQSFGPFVTEARKQRRCCVSSKTLLVGPTHTSQFHARRRAPVRRVMCLSHLPLTERFPGPTRTGVSPRRPRYRYWRGEDRRTNRPPGKVKPGPHIDYISVFSRFSVLV